MDSFVIEIGCGGNHGWSRWVSSWQRDEAMAGDLGAWWLESGKFEYDRWLTDQQRTCPQCFRHHRPADCPSKLNARLRESQVSNGHWAKKYADLMSLLERCGFVVNVDHEYIGHHEGKFFKQFKPTHEAYCKPCEVHGAIHEHKV